MGGLGVPGRRARARSPSSRLSVTAPRPHGPGCSSSTQPRTREAVPVQRLLEGPRQGRAGERLSQRRSAAAAPRGPAGGPAPAGSARPGARPGRPGCSGRRPGAGCTAGSRPAGMVRVRSPSSEAPGRSPPDPQPARWPRAGARTVAVVQLLAGRQQAQLALPRRRPGRPEAAGGPVGDLAQVDLVEEAAQARATRSARLASSCHRVRRQDPTGRPSRNQASSVASSTTWRSRLVQV